jgi:FkbM family methyltransferase
VKRLALLVLLAIVLAAAFWPPARHIALVAAGRANGCDMAHARGIADRFRVQTATKDRILAASRKVRTDERQFELWETPDGPYWIPRGSHYVLPFNLAEQEMKIYGDGELGVRPGDIVLDCGANVGVYTRASLKAGAAKVVAIEPGPENVECLRRNFEKEIAEGRVILYPKGVWDQDDLLELLVDPENSAADSFVIRRETAKTSIKVPLTTIDKLVAELNLPKVDFIKMDIEGAEVKAVQGATGTLRKYRPRMALSAYHQADHPVAVPAAAQAAQPAYQVICGPCAEVDRWNIRPDVLFFR